MAHSMDFVALPLELWGHGQRYVIRILDDCTRCTLEKAVTERKGAGVGAAFVLGHLKEGPIPFVFKYDREFDVPDFENLLLTYKVVPVPPEHHEEVKSAIHSAFYHEGTYEEGLDVARKVIQKYEKKFPEAMRILAEDLEACLTVLKLPRRHRRVVRTTNLLERLFGENRRRTRVIPHFFQEGAAMKLIYATLVAASRKWRGKEELQRKATG